MGQLVIFSSLSTEGGVKSEMSVEGLMTNSLLEKDN